MGSAIRIAVGGGKGGSGKSTVSVNLGVALAQLGMRTVLVDADLGAANLHTMLGVAGHGPTMQDLIDRRIHSLEEASTATRIPRLFLVPGVGAVVGGANPQHAQKLKVLRHVAALDADVVIVDVGAGVSYNALDFFELGDVRLVVTTPQLTSIQNAYAFLKSALHRALPAAGLDEEDRALLARVSHPSSTTERFRVVLDRVATERPALAARIEAILSSFGASLVGNNVPSAQAGNVLHGLSRMTSDFLSLQAKVIAQIPHDPAVHQAIDRRVPYLETASPRQPAARAFVSLAEHVLSVNVEAQRAARSKEGIASSLALSIAAPERADDAPSVDGYTRREERVQVDVLAQVDAGGARQDGRLLDLSPHGAFAAVLGPVPPIGAGVTIRVDKPLPLVLVGTVRRSRDGCIGVELAPASVEPCRAFLDRVAPGRLAPR